MSWGGGLYLLSHGVDDGWWPLPGAGDPHPHFLGHLESLCSEGQATCFYDPTGPAAPNLHFLAIRPEMASSGSLEPMVQRASWAPLRTPSPLPPSGGDYGPEDPASPNQRYVRLHCCSAGHCPHGQRLGGCLGLQERRGACWLLSVQGG